MPFDIQSFKKELQPGALKERAKNLNDRYTSPSSAQTGYTPSSTARLSTVGKKPPPPLPPSSTRHTQGSVASSHLPAAPPQQARPPALPRRDNSYGDQPSTSTPQRIQWSQLSARDKDQFFTLLDGFFGTRQSVASAFRADPNAQITAPPVVPALKQTQRDFSQDDQAPPPPPLWARPSSTSTPTTTTVSASAGTSQRSSGITSYPPACHTTSHAHDIANYFSRQEEWKDAWFTTESPLPPSLVGRNDMTWTCSWRTSGSQKTLTGAALFCDLSVVWWQVDWDTSHERRPGFASQVQRRARYLDCPEHLEAEQLWYACSTYGEQVATFAEQAEAAGLPIGHGECWDLASEALASVKDLPPPVPSISRTHGHLIFSGSANGKNPKTGQRGLWRGNDTNVRRGDILEWRKARVSKLDGRSWSDLGNPEHTAVIVNSYLPSEASANTRPTDGQSIAPWEVGVLEVVEQSQGKVPTRAEYDLTGMESGEIWIYRPVGMQEYIGIDQLRPDWEQPSSRTAIQYVT